MYKRMDVPPQTWSLRRPLNHISNYVLFVVIVWCYSVMDVCKDLYEPIDVIDLAKDLFRSKKNFNQKLNQWTKLCKEEDAISKRTWQSFNQDVIETLGDLSYLTHKLKNENKKKLIDRLNWNSFSSPHYDVQNFEHKDNAFDLSELHENDTFSVVDIMFYNGETIYNTESMLSKGVHEHDDDESRSTSESKEDTRRVILYAPKFVGKESKLKALGNIFGKLSATETARKHETCMKLRGYL